MEMKVTQLALIAVWLILGIVSAIKGNISCVILCSAVMIGLFIDKSGYKKGW
jgi:hypothetical protein